jgi:threonine aldolase
MIDLRSDTVTRPTPAMRRAMFEAEVGDDVYGEDPTVNRLEARAAKIIGKEAALFVPTGTMGNTIGIKVLTEHGQEVICDSRAHVHDYELSMVAWFSGCLLRAIPTERGLLSWDQVRRHIRPLGPHCAPTGAIAVEQTHNMGGGSVYPMSTLCEICDGAHERGIRVHMDGARIFNASVALDIPVHKVAAPADTVMFCLSKALGAPAGSILAGPADLIAKARLYRKRLGGGMRQAGVLAAAGLIALEESPAKLATDHANARYLAEQLARVPGIEVNPVETNIVIFSLANSAQCTQSPISPADVSARLKQHGILLNAISDRSLRAVTHYDVTRADCENAVEALSDVLAVAAATAAGRKPS